MNEDVEDDDMKKNRMRLRKGCKYTTKWKKQRRTEGKEEEASEY